MTSASSARSSALRWMAGDANWIFKADVSTSLDGTTFTPVKEAQNFDMHAKWSGPHAFPWNAPIKARHLRIRFHKDGEATNVFRLPPTMMVYDGIANDTFTAPKVGEVIATGAANAELPGRRHRRDCPQRQREAHARRVLAFHGAHQWRPP